MKRFLPLVARLAATVLVAGVPRHGAAQVPGNGPAPYSEKLKIRAERGEAAAQSALGSVYEGGTGVHKDAVAAAKWYRKAADQGLCDAQFNLGALYQRGEGVPKDAVAAAKWYSKAADQGFRYAQFNLGVMYAYGTDVPEDAVEAYKWLTLSAAMGLAPVEDLRLRLKRRMTPEQFAGVQKQIQEFKPHTTPSTSTGNK